MEEGNLNTGNYDFRLNAVSTEKSKVISTESTKLKVLIVEDNEINQIIASEIFKEYNFKIDIVSNGLDAVEILKKFKYDIIFMDLQMPIMDGFEATKNIRINDSVTPIIAISASIKKKEKELILKVGMNDYLSKPLLLDEVEKILSKYLMIKKVSNNKKNIEVNKNISLIGINIEKMKISSGIEEEVIFKMLLNFSKMYIDIENDIKDLDINSNELSSYIHKLRGVSGNLQIEEIYNLSSYIEENSTTYDKKAKIDELIFKMKKIIESINVNISLLIVRNKIIVKNEELLKLINLIIYDIENYNFIKKDRVLNIYNSLENRIEISLLHEMIKSFENNDYETLEDILRKIKRVMDE